MIDSSEAALLRSIAAVPDDRVRRLVLSDWYEENGQEAKAAFIRVQCELIADPSRVTEATPLRLQERAILNEHRVKWLRQLPYPVQDVHFAGGVIDRLRIADWQDGAFLDDPRLLTLTELDLSDLQLDDQALRIFRSGAQFPALKRLILANNPFTDQGIAELAQATGLGELEEIDLFGTGVTAAGHELLSRSPRFRDAYLDIGTPEPGYRFTAAQTDLARRQYIREHGWPLIQSMFDEYPRLESAYLCVAQYWADEADDAVHAYFVVSEHFVPTLEGIGSGGSSEKEPNLPTTNIRSEYDDSSSMIYPDQWDENSEAIPLWAAFADEGGHQEWITLQEVYRPAILFCRHGGHEFLPMIRPHLDGIRAEWEQ